MSGIHTDLNMHRTFATRGAAIPLGSKSTLATTMRWTSHSCSLSRGTSTCEACWYWGWCCICTTTAPLWHMTCNCYSYYVDRDRVGHAAHVPLDDGIGRVKISIPPFSGRWSWGVIGVGWCVQDHTFTKAQFCEIISQLYIVPMKSFGGCLLWTFGSHSRCDWSWVTGSWFPPFHWFCWFSPLIWRSHKVFSPHQFFR
jgi:hypothetical protein